jgi:hypothetical protein
LNSRRNILVTNRKELSLERYKICAEKCNGDHEIIKQERRNRSGRNKARKKNLKYNGHLHYSVTVQGTHECPF